MSKIENNTQEQMEAYMHRTVEENLVQQEGRINGMIAPEFVRCSLEDKTVLMRYPMQYWQTNRMEVVHGGILTTCMDNASFPYYSSSAGFSNSMSGKISCAVFA